LGHHVLIVHPKKLGLLRDPVALVWGRLIPDEYDLNCVGGLVLLEPLHVVQVHIDTMKLQPRNPTVMQRFVAKHHSLVLMIDHGKLLQISIGTSHLSIGNIETCPHDYSINVDFTSKLALETFILKRENVWLN